MLQALADGLLTGAIYALGAIGLTLTMGILRFANFAHAEMMTWGAYMALGVLTVFNLPTAPLGPLTFGWPLLLATAIACGLTVALALLVDWLVFRRLRDKVGHLTLVFASFGVALLIRNVIHLIFGGRATYYTTDLQIAMRVLPDLRIMPDQIFAFGMVVVLVIAVHQFLQRSPLGLSMRAVSENPSLAVVNGVSLTRVVRWTWIVGGALAAVAGILYGVTVQLRPELGFHLLLPLFAAAILGGVGNVIGAVIGGFLIGLIESFSVLVITPDYKLAVPFIVLLAVLYIRPTGLFGGTSGGR
ncbi:MAG: branched-chain amino acid ABC transporter permease [Gemmobacter sp.]|nr:branched-chain amino acid ABC transporter permease [Gemmobacter sp.]